MKQTLITAILSMTAIIWSVNAGATEQGLPSPVKFYGIDFSQAKIIGAKENDQDFMYAFQRINGLLISEEDKYNPANFLRISVIETDIDYAVNQATSLTADARQSTGGEIDLAAILSAYPAGNGYGLVIVATELNKLEERGYYTAVIYSEATKEIIWQRDFFGIAQGFGLRNYWAGSVYTGMKALGKQLKKEGRK